MKKFISIFMLFVMLFIGAHPVLAMHFCGEKLHSVAMTEKVSNCCEEESTSNNSEQLAFHGSACCLTNSVSYSTDTYSHANPLQIQHPDSLPVLILWNMSATQAILSSTIEKRIDQIHFPPEGYFLQYNDLLTYIRTFLI